MNLAEWTEQKRKTLRQLGPVQIREITPTLRDFTHAVATHRGPLAVILELSRNSPEEAGIEVDLSAWTQRADSCSVSALALGTDPSVFGCSPEDLKGVARGALPVIARDLVLVREQIYLSRLMGADAVLLHADAVAAAELKTFIDLAASTHMASAVEVTGQAGVDKALAAGARLLVVPCFGPTGALELGTLQSLKTPSSVVLIARGPFGIEQLEEVRGQVDAVWVRMPVLGDSEPDTFLARLVESAER